LEASIDGENWTEIDAQVDNNDLNGPSQVAIWPIRTAYDVRFFRITQTDTNHKPSDPEWNHLLEFSAFELFGSVRDF
jgi:hypothetical protein